MPKLFSKIGFNTTRTYFLKSEWAYLVTQQNWYGWSQVRFSFKLLIEKLKLFKSIDKSPLQNLCL
jgi:hypothetical protein